MGKKSVAGNAFYNVLYKVLIYIFPLIISGYLGRILQSDGVGQVSFVQNIVSYFTTIVALGIPTYGTREIAKCETKEQRDHVFSSLFIINAVSTVICVLVYYVMIFTVPYFSSDLLLYAVGGIQIIFNFINIDWLYQGIEEYRYIAVRSVIVRVVSIVAVFLFINDKDDAWIYLLINCAVNGGNYLFNICRARKIVNIRLIGTNYRVHLKSVFILLATVVAIDLYTKVNTTFIGFMLTDSDVGYYTYADRIVKIPIMLFAAINAVILPRLSKAFQERKCGVFVKLLSGVQDVVLSLAMPAMAGLIILSDDIVVTLFGQSFLPAGNILRFLSPLILIMSIGNLYGTQAIIAIGKENKKFIATLIAAALNIIASPILISSIGAIGACLASVISETTVLVIYLIIYRQYTVIPVQKKLLVDVIFSTILMSAVLYLLKKLAFGYLINVIVGIIVGTIVYGSSLLLINKNMRNTIKNFLRKKEIV